MGFGITRFCLGFMELVWLIKEQLTELTLIARSNEKLIPFRLLRVNHIIKFNVADDLPLL
jgi:hypothetical protein